MIRLVLRRIAAALALSVAVASFSFLALRLAPGSPLQNGRHLSPQIEENLKRAWHLDAPLWRQYLDYVGGLARGDLGPSLRHPGLRVNDIILEHFPISLKLGLWAVLLALMIGGTLGMIAASRHGRWQDSVTSGLGHAAISAPSFVVGPLLVLLVSLRLGWLPPAGLDSASAYILPAFTLSLVMLGSILRLTRSGFLDVLGQDFIRTAHAKGLPERIVLLRHALKPGIVPTLVFLGPALADAITGSVVVERIFGIPGLGASFVNSASDRDYTVLAGEVVGLVGESGCGKSVACQSVLRLLPQPPARYDSGSVQFESHDLLSCTAAKLRAVRWKRIAMVFQDPMTSLNPYLRVGDQMIEPLQWHDRVSRRDAEQRAVSMLRQVGVADAAARLRCYPHELSGGMRQRVMLATALLIRPALLIADEPTTALDVTVQAQVLDVIDRTRSETGMAVLLVSHDLGVVARICDRVLVMYAGRLVEAAGVEEIFGAPRHPYTRALLRSTPDIQGNRRHLTCIPGHPPDLSVDEAACPFSPRCEHYVAECGCGPSGLEETARGHLTGCTRVRAGALTP